MMAVEGGESEEAEEEEFVVRAVLEGSTAG